MEIAVGFRGPSATLLVAPVQEEHVSIRRIILSLTTSLLIVACGGGGGGSDSGSTPPPAPVLATQPTSQSATVGAPVSFSVSASGTDLSYQWQRSTDSAATWSNLTLASSSTYAIAAVDASMNGHQFRVVVRAGSVEVTSSAATLTVSAPVAPAISVQPASATITAGGAASFSVTASGTNLSYRWQGSSDASWLDVVPGSSSATLALSGLTVADSGRRFRVIVSNAGGSVVSDAATLTVNPVGQAPSVASSPQSLSVVTGQVATFSVSVAGGVPAPGIQWQASTNGGTSWTNIAGSSDTSYTTPPTTAADNGKRFRAVLTNPSGTVASAAAVLTVGAASAPAITSVSGYQVAYWTANDFAPRTATFSAVATGIPSPTFQWQVSTNGGVSFSNVNGATAASYTTPEVVSADNGKRFRVVVTNASGSAISGSSQLFVFNAGLGGRLSGLTVAASGAIFASTYPSNIFFTSPDGFMGVRRWQASAGVSTLAGGFTVLSTGVDVDAIGASARFVRPQGIATDAAGNVYVADWGDRIRKISPTGAVSTLAGGNPAGGLVNGTGALASFSSPTGLAIDAEGNLFVADNGNRAIRKVTPAGVVTTLASSSGFFDLNSLAIDAAGNLYATDFSLCRIWKITPAGVVSALNSAAGCFPAFNKVDGALSAATFTRTEGIAVDPSGNLFVADFDRVRKITPTGTVSTLAARFAAEVQIGRGIATDSAGNLYVADAQGGLLGSSSVDPRTYTFLVRKITPSGVESTLP